MVRVAQWFTFVLGLGAATLASAQQIVEVRGADTEYRYVDWSYTASSGVVADVFYVGVPGSNELNIGGGYSVRRGAVTITPLVYWVIGKENDQRGIKVATLITADSGGWKLVSFLGHYFSTAGDVDDYLVLDTLDLTRVLGNGWECGAQAGFFRTAGAWHQQIGPLLKHNDRRGTWAISYRFGPEREFRIGRTFTF